MISWLPGLLLALMASGMLPADPGVHPDAFVSVSCPRPDACLLLDAAGNLFFSEDGGRTRHPRDLAPGLELTQVRFTGLLMGWALDRRGRLWRTRDGGHRFSALRQPGALPPGERASQLALAPDGRVWLGTRSGRVFRLGRDGRFGLMGEGPAEPVVSLAVDGRGAAAAYASGSILSLPSAPGLGAVLRSRPLKLRAAGVATTADGRLVVAGCRGAVRWSADRGRTWTGPQRGPRSTACLRPVVRYPGGPVVMVAGEGGLVLADPVRGIAEELVDPLARRFVDAARVGDRVLLVGAGGAIAVLGPLPKGGWGLTAVATPAPAVTGLHLSGRKTVVRIRQGGALEVSLDGGETWRPMASPGKASDRAVFTDARHGFALVDDRSIAGTLDGGKTWQALGSWSDLALTDLDFVDPQTGWAVGRAGAVVRTTDGGRTWALDRVPAYSGDLSRVQFTDRKHGFAVGPGQAVFRTLDGGTTWHRLRTGPGDLHGLHFLDAKRGFVIGDAGLVMVTRDGCEQWHERSVPADARLVAISFSDPLRGLVAGEGGRLWATLDGGHSWHPVHLGTRAEIRALACLSKSGRCLVAGDGGLLMVGDPFRGLIQ